MAFNSIDQAVEVGIGSEDVAHIMRYASSLEASVTVIMLFPTQHHSLNLYHNQRGHHNAAIVSSVAPEAIAPAPEHISMPSTDSTEVICRSVSMSLPRTLASFYTHIHIHIYMYMCVCV